LQQRLQAAWRGVAERSIRPMRLIHLGVAAAMTLSLASTATASPVLVLDRGHVHHENDPFLAPASTLPAAPAGARAAAHPRARASQAAPARDATS